MIECRLNINLKPCPFCGGKANVRVDVGRNFVVFCEQCHAYTQERLRLLDALELWNMRCESEAQPLKVLFKVLRKGATIPIRNNGAAYDLFIPEDVKIEAGETVKIRLGFACKLPDGYHALINMRSSTWGKWGLCLSNQTGIIDNGYCGESDEWILSVYRPNSFKEFPTLIPAGTRIAQFRLERDCPELEFEKVDHLTSLSRGGFGSTGD